MNFSGKGTAGKPRKDQTMDLESFIQSGFANIDLIDEQYSKYVQNPLGVDPSWRKIFDAWDAFQPKKAVPVRPPSPFGYTPKEEASAQATAVQVPEKEVSVLYQTKPEAPGVSDVRIFNLIEGYRTYGHLMAKVNPIETHPPVEPFQLKLETYGFTKQDLTRSFSTFGFLPESQAQLLQIVQALKETYCDQIGVEYMGLQNPELENWLQKRIEPTRFKIQLSIEQKQMILQQLNKSELFESFLHTKYVGQKRFSLEGGETLIPMISAMIETGAGLGVEEFVLGMAHRGRLNVLCNILNKSYVEIFSEFDESYIPDSFEGSGDVKYHRGFFAELKMPNGEQVKIDLSPNPSHLESVDPVVEGMTRAKQVKIGDENDHKRVVSVLIHGDAALAGQGVVYETMQLYNLEGYSTGGTLHFVINNQIGFTTLPKDGRSTLYCTDIAKAFSAPVFHVNTEDPEGCVYVTNLAMEIRQKFHCDVFIELNCYRKYGHNEGDEPAFTQPLEYQLIRKKRPIREIYSDELIQQGVVEKYLAESLEAEFKKSLNQALKSIKEGEKKEPSKISEERRGNGNKLFQQVETGVSKQVLQDVAERICDIPEGFNIHPKLTNWLKERLSMVKEGNGAKPIDWGMGETLAYATLLVEGHSVRISGQDCCRGTFSHRHAMWMDQIEENSYYPLKHLQPGQARFDIYNSPLSEFAVLGFEFGYSEADPETLVIWEAQFGDFANGGQIVIDSYISSSEQKWGLKSGLVLFLPHGYEGQGPDHSSARMERYLTLAGHDNMRIVYPTTPAQLFHLLRRQLLHPVCKPLVVFTPKGLLRHPECVSYLDDFTHGSFQEILDDPKPPADAKRVVLCSGRMFYEIAAMRAKVKVHDMAVIRIEQLYPFHVERLRSILDNYEGYKEIIWAQEEPANMGAWDFLRPQLREFAPKHSEVRYVGRERSASTAVGSHAVHKHEVNALLQSIFKEYELPIPEDQVKV